MPRWLLAFSLVVSACDVDIPEGRIACETAADCPTGWYCVVDRCYSTPGDAGCPDCDAGCTDCGDAGCTSDAECDDGLDCTEDVCTGGACRNDLLVDRCLIDGACLEAGALGAECRECAPAISTTAWSASAPSSSCQTTGGASGTCEGLDGAPLCCAGATRVSAGATHTCSIRTDGSLYCWGSNAGGQLGVGDTTYRALPTRVGVDADWTHLATTHSQTCALRSSGALYCWGIVGGAITPAPARVGSDSDWTAIALVSFGPTFGGHACGLRAGGSLWCWGQNESGQLGLGDVAPRAAPTRVGTDIGWAEVAVGAAHACARKEDGSLYCWGDAEALGLGTLGSAYVSVPTRVGTDADWAQLAAGRGHTCATRTDGSLWCWGENAWRQTGSDATSAEPVLVPTRVGTELDWTAIALGSAHSCGVRANQTLWCWGSNSHGELGLGSETADEAPTQVGTGTAWASVDPGLFHTCATRTDGSLFCWGLGSNGQLGSGGGGGFAEPQRISSCASVPDDRRCDGTCCTRPTQLALTGYNSYSVRSDGTLWVWGGNGGGHLGLGDTEPRPTPVQLGTETTWTAVAAADHACALQADGTLWCWGNNSQGELGLGDQTRRLSPTRVGTDTDWSAVTVGFQFSCALKSDRTLWCWGGNFEAQLGLGDTVRRSIPTRVGTSADWARVSSGFGHSCASKTDGSLYCWGRNGSAALGLGFASDVPTTTPTRVGTGTSWTLVVASLDNSCALQTDGSAWCWGNIGFPAVTSPTRVVAAQTWVALSKRFGYNGTPLLADDGALFSLRVFSPLDLPRESTASSWDLAEGGGGSTCAVQRGDGSLWCWGLGGALGFPDDEARSDPWRVGCL